MSTYLYLTCFSHDPPLSATEESGQHLRDLPRIRGEINEDREKLYGEGQLSITWDKLLGRGIDSYFRRHSVIFLSQHMKCDVRIITEYGEDVTREDKR